jgi:hypothetical protein
LAQVDIDLCLLIFNIIINMLFLFPNILGEINSQE